PRGMAQRLVHGGPGHALRRPGAERPPRRREDEPRQLRGLPAGDALQHGAVLRVDGDDLPTALARGAGDELARHHQRLLVGQRRPSEPVALAPEHLQRGAPDGAGGAQDRDADAHATPNSRNSAAVSGSTKYSESRRSSTPP